MSRKKSQKVRVAFRKNRQNRARSQNLTKESLDDLERAEDLETGERLSGKGELARYRTVITGGDEESGPMQREVDLSRCRIGLVLSAIGANQCRVRARDGCLAICTIRRVVRTLARDARNAVVAGDCVLFTPDGEDRGVIERVEPRTSTLSRGSRGHEHILVANVDQAVIVASVDDPPLKLGLIDRFLCSTETGNVRGIICINKVDLLDRPPLLQPIVGQYARLGYRVVLTNALTGVGIPELRRLLRGHASVFAGQSGVGKSSLLNAIQPGLGQRIGAVSTDTHKGRHTTRVTELFELDGGGWIVDTPGIRQMQLWDVAREEVEGQFIEFRPFVHRCRFPNCLHTHEADCGVKQGVELGLITPLRYESYLRIVGGDE